MHLLSITMSLKSLLPAHLWFCLLLVTWTEPITTAASGCLLITEVNADNPKVDTREFVELQYSSGQKFSLDGYTLVFYNGNGNTAYKVLNLTGYTTDEEGFFLVGSSGVATEPEYLLPHNTVQNGPDGIALYYGEEKYDTGMTVTAVGLVDAIVYKSHRSDTAEVLQATLTPGIPAFLEDDSFRMGDESIERCLMSGREWTFQAGPPSPRQRNPCISQAELPIGISEVGFGGDQGPFVELHVLPHSPASLSLVFIDGVTATVSLSFDIHVLSVTRGMFLIATTESGSPADQVLNPDAATLLQKQARLGGAIALYSKDAGPFPVGALLSQEELLDAVVYKGENDLNPELSKTLLHGREPFNLSSRSVDGSVSLSRCGMANWTQDSGLFVETVPTPGQNNSCSGVALCPKTVAPSPTPPKTYVDFLLNEVNTDSPGSEEDLEFIELWHTSGKQASLENIWLLLFNGKDNKRYKEIHLIGYHTDERGFFLLGGAKVTPKPQYSLPPNIVQNGPDAIALYRSLKGPPSSQESQIPTEGLLDAVVYRSHYSAAGAQALLEALTPGQSHILEDPSFSAEDESLSRCHNTYPRNLDAFKVALLTPMEPNACNASTSVPATPTPLPSASYVISEVSSSNWTSQTFFVELQVEPFSSLVGFVLVLFEKEGAQEFARVPLQGKAKDTGYFLIGSNDGSDQQWPLTFASLPSTPLAGVALFNNSSVLNLTIVDAVVFTKNEELLQKLNLQKPSVDTTMMYQAQNVSFCLCTKEHSMVWSISRPSPGTKNHCHFEMATTPVWICLTVQGNAETACLQWKNEENDMLNEVTVHLEDRCQCGLTILSLQTANVTCDGGLVYVRGSIQAQDEEQLNRIRLASWEATAAKAHLHTRGRLAFTNCSETKANQFGNKDTSVGWEIAVIIGVLLVTGIAVAAAVYLYRRRNPRNYSTIELSYHGEGSPDF
ncbi:uncharacterized protein si:ch211-183d21.1 isoform X1 [Erpetoichthys calabaricus]|uniref:uncharacterized protein si:ch211-183d21.1 isoform X1 n=1 Tax=Erpetoichthys calabaricus TaxID=27687 RepID=UPI002234A419|nr:uncharacterized protein si:ch211-183d21.1 isoform X1 [Erpetoichthys calabaricus]